MLTRERCMASGRTGNARLVRTDGRSSTLRRVVACGSQLVDVPPAKQHNGASHYRPRAMTLPLGDSCADAVHILQPGRPVVVYSWDHQ
jgi:hypothetical protein